MPLRAARPNTWPKTRPTTQRGIAALEFAVVLIVLFTLLYAVVSYALVMLVQQSLAQRAGQAAQLLLAEQLQAGQALPGNAVCPVPVASVATQGDAWLTRMVALECRLIAAVPLGPLAQYQVVVRYPNYARQPALPNLLGFAERLGGVRWLPAHLEAQAAVMLPIALAPAHGGATPGVTP